MVRTSHRCLPTRTRAQVLSTHWRRTKTIAIGQHRERRRHILPRHTPCTITTTMGQCRRVAVLSRAIIPRRLLSTRPTSMSYPASPWDADRMRAREAHMRLTLIYGDLWTVYHCMRLRHRLQNALWLRARLSRRLPMDSTCTTQRLLRKRKGQGERGGVPVMGRLWRKEGRNTKKPKYPSSFLRFGQPFEMARSLSLFLFLSLSLFLFQSCTFSFPHTLLLHFASFSFLAVYYSSSSHSLFYSFLL